MIRSKAFTLIELLIVVAIIAILAAIAVPNFLEAQTRSKVSRTWADLRTMATAIEAYTVDNNAPPIDGSKTDGQAYWYLPGGPTVPGGAAGVTSPIAYMTNVRLVDPFRSAVDATSSYNLDTPDNVHFTPLDYRRYRYTNFPYTYSGTALLTSYRGTFEEVYGKWRLIGNGPDKVYNSDPGIQVPNFQSVGLNPIYDPTNGTISRGDIIRSQKFPQQPGPHGPGY